MFCRSDCQTAVSWNSSGTMNNCILHLSVAGKGQPIAGWNPCSRKDHGTCLLVSSNSPSHYYSQGGCTFTLAFNILTSVNRQRSDVDIFVPKLSHCLHILQMEAVISHRLERSSQSISQKPHSMNPPKWVGKQLASIHAINKWANIQLKDECSYLLILSEICPVNHFFHPSSSSFMTEVSNISQSKRIDSLIETLFQADCRRFYRIFPKDHSILKIVFPSPRDKEKQ